MVSTEVGTVSVSVDVDRVRVSRGFRMRGNGATRTPQVVERVLVALVSVAHVVSRVAVRVARTSHVVGLLVVIVVEVFHEVARPEVTAALSAHVVGLVVER